MARAAKSDGPPPLGIHILLKDAARIFHNDGGAISLWNFDVDKHELKEDPKPVSPSGSCRN